jgi:SOS-response transcriptional repressor LexA
MKYTLTKKQSECLAFLRGYIEEHDAAPSLDEIAEALNIKSKSGSHRLLSALERRGYITRIHGVSRAISLVPERDEELVTLRQIKDAAADFITRHRAWRDAVTVGGPDYDEAGHANGVTSAFQNLGRMVGA